MEWNIGRIQKPFISFVHSHILCVLFIIPLYCMHVRMPYVLIKDLLTYLLVIKCKTSVTIRKQQSLVIKFRLSVLVDREKFCRRGRRLCWWQSSSGRNRCNERKAVFTPHNLITSNLESSIEYSPVQFSSDKMRWDERCERFLGPFHTRIFYFETLAKF